MINLKTKSQLVTRETIIDHPKYPVIDFHAHMGKLVYGSDYEYLYDTKTFVEDLKALGVSHIVNLDGMHGEDFMKMQQKVKGYERFITLFGYLDFSDPQGSDFVDKNLNIIEDVYRNGAKGIKILKDVTLTDKNRPEFIRLDDKKLIPIFTSIAEKNMIVLSHIGDPKAFFEPVTEKNERYYGLSLCPEWSFSDDKYLSFEELMEMQENMLKQNSDTVFVIPHAGSYGENLNFVDNLLDSCGNMYIDISARLAEFGRQPYSSRRFFIKHQDKILFGTDCIPTSKLPHKIYYRFLETDDEYFDYAEGDSLYEHGAWKIYGLDLPDEVLEKIYNLNAKKLLNIT